MRKVTHLPRISRAPAARRALHRAARCARLFHARSAEGLAPHIAWLHHTSKYTKRSLPASRLPLASPACCHPLARGFCSPRTCGDCLRLLLFGCHCAATSSLLRRNRLSSALSRSRCIHIFGIEADAFLPRLAYFHRTDAACYRIARRACISPAATLRAHRLFAAASR